MNNKVEKKRFLGMDVRVINEEYLPIKDIFLALNRLDSNGKITTRDRDKVKKFVDYGLISGSTKCTLTSKGKSKSRTTQDLECIYIKDLPMILTQFEPSEKKDGSNKEQINNWIEFMKFVNDILVSLEVHKYIVTDKQKQLDHHELIVELGGKPVVENKMVNVIMAELIGIDGSIKKDELRTYQNQTTVDLLEVRDYVMNKFEQAYEIEESHSKAKEIAKRLAFKKYPMIKSA